MTADAIWKRQNAVPFEPYQIMLTDGRQILVPHLDFASVSEAEDSITIYDAGGGVEIVDLALIVSVKYGGRKRRVTK